MFKGWMAPAAAALAVLLLAGTVETAEAKNGGGWGAEFSGGSFSGGKAYGGAAPFYGGKVYGSSRFYGGPKVYCYNCPGARLNPGGTRLDSDPVILGLACTRTCSECPRIQPTMSS
jgi:hypothetical protein